MDRSLHPTIRRPQIFGVNIYPAAHKSCISHYRCYTKFNSKDVNIGTSKEKRRNRNSGYAQKNQCTTNYSLSRQITLGIVLVGSAIVILLGIFFGILLAKTGRRRNILAESILNAVTAIPPVAYLIIFIGIWGNSIPTMLVALTASLVLRMIKLVKTLIEGEYDKAYIMCAIACGASKMRIMLVHILPNIIRDVVQFICLSCAEMIIAISGFSFIGLSLGDDVIDWGVMLSDARALAGTHPQLLFYPIFFIFISSLCFNYLGRLLEKEGA